MISSTTTAKDGKYNWNWSLSVSVDYWKLSAWLFCLAFAALFVYDLVLLWSSGLGVFTGFWSVAYKAVMLIITVVGLAILYFKNRASAKGDNQIAAMLACAFVIFFFIDTTTISGKHVELNGMKIVDDEQSSGFINSFFHEVIRFPDKIEIEIEVDNEVWNITYGVTDNGSGLYHKYGSAKKLRLAINRSLDSAMASTTDALNDADPGLFMQHFVGILHTVDGVTLREFKRN